jgi:hypothetical protein
MNQGNATPDSYVRWIFYPEGTLAALRMLLLYFGFPEYARGPKVERLYVYPSDLWRARVLLGCRNSKAENPRQEHLHLGAGWESNLVTAGINPKTLEVVDQKRWALAWEQGLKKSRHPTFYPERIEARYDRGEFVPEDCALQPTFGMGKGKKPGTRTEETRARNDYVSQRLREAVRPRDMIF